MDLLGILGLGSGIFSSIMQAHAQAKQRARAMKFLHQLIDQQNQDFATAKTSLASGEAEYRNDPRRAQNADLWQKRLASPDVITPEMESILRNSAFSSAAADAGAGTSVLREQLQRSGLGGSGLGAKIQADAQASGYGRAAAINNDLTVKTGQANRQARDSLYSQYQDYLDKDSANLYGFKKDVAGLYGSKQYGNSAVLAGIG